MMIVLISLQSSPSYTTEETNKISALDLKIVEEFYDIVYIVITVQKLN